MPLALLASLLPLLLDLGSFFAGDAAGKAGATALGSTLAKGSGKVLPSVGRFLTGKAGTAIGGIGGGILANLLLKTLIDGPEQQLAEPIPQNGQLTGLLAQLQNSNPEQQFMQSVQDRQLRGTLGQALTQSGVDLNQLTQGVL